MSNTGLEVVALHDAFYDDSLHKRGSVVVLKPGDACPYWAVPKDRVKVMTPAERADEHRKTMADVKGRAFGPLAALRRLYADQLAERPVLEVTPEKAPATAAPVKKP